MRLYRFINTDKKIDVVVVTDGSCDQKRIFITESPRGVVPAGSANPSADEKAGSDAFLALGWKWNDENACVLSVYTTVPAEKEIEIYFPNSVKLNNSIGRYGVIEVIEKCLHQK